VLDDDATKKATTQPKKVLILTMESVLICSNSIEISYHSSNPGQNPGFFWKPKLPLRQQARQSVLIFKPMLIQIENMNGYK
jgi:hypothetical protein